MIGKTMRQHESEKGGVTSHVERIGSTPAIGSHITATRAGVVYRHRETGREFAVLQEGFGLRVCGDDGVKTWITRNELRKNFDLVRRPGLTPCSCTACRCYRERDVTPRKPICFQCYSGKHDGVAR